MRFVLVLAMVFSVLAVAVPTTGIGQALLPGDCNESGSVDIDDPVFAIQYLYLGGTFSTIYGRLNCDCDNNPGVTPADVYYLTKYIFDPTILFYASGTSLTQTGRTFVYTEYTADGTTGSNVINIYIKTHPDEDISGFVLPFSYASEPGEAVVDIASVDLTGSIVGGSMTTNYDNTNKILRITLDPPLGATIPGGTQGLLCKVNFTQVAPGDPIKMEKTTSSRITPLLFPEDWRTWDGSVVMTPGYLDKSIGEVTGDHFVDIDDVVGLIEYIFLHVAMVWW